MRSYLHELAQSDPKEDEPWLGSVPDEIEKFTGQWERDVIAPTTGLSDLMYKSVGIRDARHSLQLGLSMWRLSWITFIFLPLTFTVGFFGMNVDTFHNNPPIKWYAASLMQHEACADFCRWFITSIPVLVVVMILWYGVKHTLSTQRQNPLRRGVYEALYHELATEHTALWTRRGPRSDIVPVGWWSSIRWRLATAWFGSDKLRMRPNYDPATEEFGVWSRTKRYLVRRWLSEIAVMPTASVSQMAQSDDLASLENHSLKDLGAVGELLSIATPVAIAELDPTAASRLQKRLPSERFRSLSPTRSDGGGSTGRASSEGRNSGVMIEEKGPSEDERSGDEDEMQRRKDRKLSVPFETAR